MHNARVGFGKSRYGFEVVSGQLEPGEAGSGKIVASVKQLAQERAGNQLDYMLLDAAAGIGCPVIASVTGSDFAVLVTEPTPSALADVQRAFGVVKHFGMPAGVIINKSDLSLDYVAKVQVWAESEGIEILGLLPYDKIFVQALVEAKPVVEYGGEIAGKLEAIAEKLLSLL